MSSLTTNPASPAVASPAVASPAAGHRAQIVAEAVVSAYLREITPPRRARVRAGVRDTCPGSPRVTGRTPLTAWTRTRTRTLAPRRWAATTTKQSVPMNP
jgi:hypothetical protein